METMQITKDAMLGDIITNHPEIIDTLESLGVHCVGCSVSAYETLEQGFKGHGMNDEQINEALTKLNNVATTNNVIEKPEIDTNSLSVTITDNAAKQVKTLLEKQNKKDHGLRIKVAPGGCSGMQYYLDFDNKTTEDDKIFEKNGIKVYIDKESLSKMNNATVDFVETLNESGFKIENPSSSSGCGCGKSFA